jgi:hypothetical protein
MQLSALLPNSRYMWRKQQTCPFPARMGLMRPRSLHVLDWTFTCDANSGTVSRGSWTHACLRIPVISLNEKTVTTECRKFSSTHTQTYCRF